MTKMRLIGEIKDVEVFIPYDQVKLFLYNFFKFGYGLNWVTESSNVYLVIDTLQGSYKIPFFRYEDNIVLSMAYMPLYHKEVYKCLEDCIQTFKGDGLIYSFDNTGVYEAVYIKGSLLSYKEFDYNGNIMSETSPIDFNYKTLADQTISQLELDYYLMKLYHFLKNDNLDDVEKTKKVLEELRENWLSYQYHF